MISHHLTNYQESANNNVKVKN